MAKIHHHRQQYTHVRYSTPKPTAANPTPTPYVSGGSISERTEAGIYAQPPIPTFKGSTGMVVVLGTTLLVFATWDSFGKPFFNSLIFATPFQPPQSWNMEIGGVVLIVIMAMIASMSEESAGVMLLAVIAMWMVFIIFNGQKTIQNVFGWFQKGTGQSTGTTSTTSMKVPNPSSSSGSKQGTTLM